MPQSDDWSRLHSDFSQICDSGSDAGAVLRIFGCSQLPREVGFAEPVADAPAFLGFQKAFYHSSGGKLDILDEIDAEWEVLGPQYWERIDDIRAGRGEKPVERREVFHLDLDDLTWKLNWDAESSMFRAAHRAGSLLLNVPPADRPCIREPLLKPEWFWDLLRDSSQVWLHFLLSCLPATSFQVIYEFCI